MTPSHCPACGAVPAPDAAFCSRCGKSLDPAAAPAGSRGRVALAALAALVVVAVAVGLARARATPPVPAAADVSGPAAPAMAPDISRLSPAERFDRLYRRVMQAARTGDSAAMQLAPMALGAFEMLDSVTADERYHAALIRLHLGDAAGARAFGDSILAGDSTHLLGYVARGMAYRWERDTAGLRPVYAAYRRLAASELASGRPEYAEHRMILEEFRASAGAAP
ncbi:MAG TPA: zinc ribbon domain-containing protein [Gemmatimonadales bacterium]|nr:zinc ribbon domain-containing protein [Gemmatimonadales bacterium]